MLAARLLLSILAALAIAAWAALAPARRSPTAALPSRRRPRLVQPVALKKSEVRLTFVGHSTWLIESAAGVDASPPTTTTTCGRRSCPISPP